MNDIRFLGDRSPVDGLLITVGHYSKFSDGNTLHVRVGADHINVIFGTGSGSDVVITKHDMARQLAVRLNAALRFAKVFLLNGDRTVVVQPHGEVFCHASFTIGDAVEIEKRRLIPGSVLGDIRLGSTGDVETIDREMVTLQDIVVRTITSARPALGLREAYEFCAGPDQWYGRALTRDMIKELEGSILSAITRDGRYNVSRVRAIPISNEAIQPVIYLGQRVLNMPIMINVKTGEVVSS